MDYSRFNDFSAALNADSYDDDLLADLIYTGVNAYSLSLGEPTFQHGELKLATSAMMCHRSLSAGLAPMRHMNEA